jgi:hypothetical protein
MAVVLVTMVLVTMVLATIVSMVTMPAVTIRGWSPPHTITIQVSGTICV